jgi:hypothetical protein
MSGLTVYSLITVISTSCITCAVTRDRYLGTANSSCQLYYSSRLSSVLPRCCWYTMVV